MKTFSTAFNTEKNTKIGVKPVWILKCPFPSTGTIYLSDSAFTVASWNGGITTKSWINNWGSIDEDISGDRAMTKVSEFSFGCIIDPNTSPNMDTILWTAANKPEITDCTLYLWFVGLNAATDPPVAMWTGNIIDWEKADELTLAIRMADPSVRLNKNIGTQIDATTYAGADPDDIGKISNIIYGAPTKVRCHAIDAGAVDVTTAAMTASSPGNSGTLVMSDASRYPAASAFTVQFDSEQIRFASRSGNTLTLAASGARGYNSTTAAIHKAGVAGYEVKTEYVYKLADHPVKSITDVFVDNVRQLTGYTAYTGKPGNSHASYPAKAVISFSALPDIRKQTMQDLGHSHDVGGSTSVIVPPSHATDWVAGQEPTVTNVISNAYDQSDSTFVKIDCDNINTATWNKLRINVGAWSGGAISNIYACITHKTQYTLNTGSGFECWAKVTEAGGSVYLDGSNTKVTQKFSIGSTWPSNNRFNIEWANNWISIVLHSELYEVWLEVVATASAENYAGMSSADVVIGNSVNVNCEGYCDADYALNGTFASDTLWTKGSGWAISGGTANASAGSASNLTQTTAQMTVGKIYEVTFTVSTRTAGSVTAKIGTGAGTARSTNATFTESITATTTGSLIFSKDSTFNGKIDNVTVVEIPFHTGTVGALIERPDLVMQHFLYTYLSLAVASFSTDAAASFASDGYKFAILINEAKKAKEWIAAMAFQCRCYFRMTDKAYLLYRPDSLSSDKTVTAAMIAMTQDWRTTTRVSRSRIDEIINKVTISYDKDWSKSGEAAYRGLAQTTDATSIAAYGEKELKENFDFVIVPAMATDIRDFYLARYKDRKKIVGMALFLDNAELEFADAVTITPQSSLLGEVQKVNFQPGSAMQNRNDKIQVIVRDY